ncbi:hypothetical protein GE061_004412 [Apolygus lucorum]|uniref:Uncharacterized protein n=1 Tax=Apolygus lucorum TaxID=248454 RepID=A0A8S9X1R3_APOLU|nr:hypothetical protein GE061_004412 [Apolygus lucorum]
MTKRCQAEEFKVKTKRYQAEEFKVMTKRCQAEEFKVLTTRYQAAEFKVMTKRCQAEEFKVMTKRCQAEEFKVLTTRYQVQEFKVMTKRCQAEEFKVKTKRYQAAEFKGLKNFASIRPVFFTALKPELRKNCSGLKGRFSVGFWEPCLTQRSSPGDDEQTPKLMSQIGDWDIIRFVKVGRLRWGGHVARMTPREIPWKLLDETLQNKRRLG